MTTEKQIALANLKDGALLQAGGSQLRLYLDIERRLVLESLADISLRKVETERIRGRLLQIDDMIQDLWGAP